MYSSTSSTSSARSSAPASVAPASTWTSLISRAASVCSTALRSSRPSWIGTAMCAASKLRGSLASCAWKYRVGASPARTRPRPTVASPGSSTTRSGGTNAMSSSKRTVSCGSSASTVPAPVSNAPARARQCITSRRDASPLIHFESPLASAVRPSRLQASFTRTHGRLRSTRDRNPRFNCRADAAIRPCSTTIPAARSASKPAPSTCGNGSRIAATTRPTPAAIKASTQGPVLPVCAQGSRVTYAVAPRARSPAACSATISACGPPAIACQPSAITSSSWAMTQPTIGLGLVV